MPFEQVAVSRGQEVLEGARQRRQSRWETAEAKAQGMEKGFWGLDTHESPLEVRKRSHRTWSLVGAKPGHSTPFLAYM